MEEIKHLLIPKLRERKMEKHFSVKTYLSFRIGRDYSYLSRLFSEAEGITVENYFILLRLEKTKELISYGEYTLSEIASDVGYSSVQHLSAQFKKILGISTREFKSSLSTKRKFIDQVTPAAITHSLTEQILNYAIITDSACRSFYRSPRFCGLAEMR